MGVLRFLLAVTVVLTHSGPILGTKMVDGRIAVEAFFIISGFYMALILNEKYIGINGSYKLFISNRLLRLYPVYWTILLCCVLFSMVIYFNSHGNKASFLQPYFEYSNLMKLSSFCFLLFTNVFLFFQDVLMFMSLDSLTGGLYFTPNYSATRPYLYVFLLIPQAWTLGLELAFYLIAPFLVRKKLQLIILLITTSILLRIILSRYGLTFDPWFYRFFPTELVFFLLGIVSYKIYFIIRKKGINKFYLKTIWAILLAFTILYEFIPLPGKIYIYFFTFFLCIPFVFLLTNKWKQDSYIGELSYPIYLSHIFVLACMNGLNLPQIGGIGFSLSIYTIAFSILIHEFIAQRIDRIRQNRIKTSTHHPA